MFRILPLGKGNAFTRTGFPTSFLIFFDDLIFLFDCPAPLRRILFEAEKLSGMPLDINQVSGVFLSHLHADHSNGLEEIGYYTTKIIKSDPLPLICEESLPEILWTQKLSGSMGASDKSKSLNTFFNPIGLKEGQASELDLFGKKITVTVRKTLHSIPCFAFKIEYDGKCLGMSADTEFDEGLFDFFQDASVIIHDANDSFNHTMIAELESLPEETKMKIFMTHLQDGAINSSSTLRIAEPGEFIEIT